MNKFHPLPNLSGLVSRDSVQKSKPSFRIKTVFFLLLLLSGSQLGKAVGSWSTLSNPAPHNNEGVMLLLSDGRVMCKSDGGGGSAGNYIVNNNYATWLVEGTRLGGVG